MPATDAPIPADIHVTKGALAEALGVSKATINWRQRNQWPNANGRKVKTTTAKWPDRHGIRKKRTLLCLADALAFSRSEPEQDAPHIILPNGRKRYAHTIPLSNNETKQLGGSPDGDELINTARICLDYGIPYDTFTRRQRGKHAKGWAALNGATMRQFPRQVGTPAGPWAGRRGTHDFYLRSEADKVFAPSEPGVYLEEDGKRTLNQGAAKRLYGTSDYMIKTLHKAGRLPSLRIRKSPRRGGKRETVMDEDELRTTLAERRNGKLKEKRWFDGLPHVKTETTAQMIDVPVSVVLDSYKHRIEFRAEAGILWWSEPSIKQFLDLRKREEERARGLVSCGDIAEELDVPDSKHYVWLSEILRQGRQTGELREGTDWWMASIPIHRPDCPRKKRRGQPILYERKPVFAYLERFDQAENPPTDSNADGQAEAKADDDSPNEQPTAAGEQPLQRAKPGPKGWRAKLLSVYDRIREENPELDENTCRDRAVSKYNHQYAGRGKNRRAERKNLNQAIRDRRRSTKNRGK